MKKKLLLIILSVFCLNTINAEVAWELSENGTLTISGTGDMENYYYDDESWRGLYKAPWLNQRESIKNVIIKNGITSIGNYAFYGCTNLTSISIPNSVTYIGDFSFHSCSYLISIAIPNSVTYIGEEAFWLCKGLKSLSIPNSVENIGYRAFNGCGGLISIKVESENAYYDSRDNCNAIISKNDNMLICGCENTIIPNSITSLGDGAFSTCSGLTSISIPNSVTSIGCETFCYTGLTSITIPNSVTNIGDCSFADCTDLTSVTMPNNMTSINQGMFWNCTGLTFINIPNSITYIGDKAFAGCTSLKKAIIDANKDLQIGANVFDQNGLEELIMDGENLPKYTNDNFAYGLYNTTILYVPSVLYDKYCSISPWNKFKNIRKYPSINLVDGETFANKEKNDGQDISYTRNFTNTSWQALYIPFSLNYDDWKDEFEVAYINGVRQLDKDDNGTIDETIMDVIKIKSGSTSPNMPYLIKAKTTGEKTFSVTNASLYPAEENSIDCSTTIAKYTFTGTYNTISSTTMIANKYYAMGGGQLITSDGSNDLKPYRWYMKVESRNSSYNASNAAKTITINVIDEEGETTTGVEELQMTNYKSPVYDLNGRKVNENNLKPGIYVKNGKKFVVK